MRMHRFFRVVSFSLLVSFFLHVQADKEFFFTCKEITPAILQRMVYTWHAESTVPLEELRYLMISHYDFEGAVCLGELVVQVSVVDDLAYIFKRLYEVKFPIQSMILVDEFEGSDDASMRANNSSAFYARKVAGTDRWSNHAYGLAVDINPLLNPYSKGSLCCPVEGKYYLDRTLGIPGMITADSFIYRLFKERGWQWGGECFYERDGVIDRHHFQKIVIGSNKTTN